jgi:hypothetical protein
VFPSFLSGVNPTTLNGMILYYRLMTEWSGLGDSMELSRVGLSQKFPSRFQAPTNIPRYDRDTNPSVWLEDYRLTCHAGGATDDLFVIKNLPLYLSDSARMWLEHLPHDKIQD